MEVGGEGLVSGNWSRGSWGQRVWVGGVGIGGVGVGGIGFPVRDTNPTLTVFQAADPYSTSHVSRQIVFASNRPRVKSSSHPVARVKFVRVNCHIPTRFGEYRE